MTMHAKIIATVRDEPGISALRIARRIGMQDLPSRVIAALHELRSASEIDVHFSGRVAYYYPPGTEQPTPSAAENIPKAKSAGPSSRQRILDVLPEYGQPGMSCAQITQIVNGAVTKSATGRIAPTLSDMYALGLITRYGNIGRYTYTLPYEAKR